jgi:hypothetical protein
VEVIELGLRRPSQEEVFVALTGPAGPARAGGRALPASTAAPARKPRLRRAADRSRAPARHTRGDIRAITARNLRRITRSPQTLALSLGQPILLLLGFR